jgi:glycosyltransferase involved in cell wall biosynthesis
VVGTPPLTAIIIVPAFDEAGTIGGVVRGLRTACPGVPVIVVDDGSADDTAARAAAAGADRVIRAPRRAGKAAALAAGFAAALSAGAQMVATLDGDSQHDPADLPRLLAAARESPGALVLGDRLAGGGDRIPAVRLGAIRAADTIVRWLTRAPVHDSQCGLRCYPAAFLGRLRFREGGFVLETEALVAAARLGYGLVSVPVRSIYPPGRASRFRAVADGGRIGWYLGRAVLREVAGRAIGRERVDASPVAGAPERGPRSPRGWGRSRLTGEPEHVTRQAWR